MSRPNESEPIRNTCFTVSPSNVVISPASPGRRSRLAASKSVGSTVPRYGAAMEIRMRTASAVAPMRTDQFCRIVLIADPWVEKHIGKVDQQVDHHVDEGEEKNQPLDRGEVAREHRVDGQPPEPGNRV